MNPLERDLPEPQFILRDPEGLTRELVRQFEALTGKTLYPAQVERLLVNVIAYRESLVREAIQDAAKLNLVRYSRAPVLDYLGENIGVTRLPAARAGCRLRFRFDPPPATAQTLEAGVVVQGGAVQFATCAEQRVAAGARSIEVQALCLEAGGQGNGFLPGQINTLVSPTGALAVAEVSNLDTTQGGAEEEDDEHLRQRIVLAPEQFSNAASVGAYRYHVLSSHPDVIDVAVLGAQMEVRNGQLVSTNGIPPGVVLLHPLTRQGLPGEQVKAAVLAACNADKVRPLTDHVQVRDPQPVDFALRAELTLYTSADAAATLQRAQEAAEALRDRLQSRLGSDVVCSQLVQALHVAGVYSVKLLAPTTDLVLGPAQWPRCTGVSLRHSGSAEG
ncbi:phage tail protein [Herbaspirillum seropedicae]|uniref:Bacteriophage tail fiber protein n=1 Tax=Herbaspirillum seropedicae (strain SmR1) TaxID=757424 RepID=D8IV18_HERSS|nr:baseplate J/gp47 family protein [Herbaspirillum seropedicae]ADJ61737.1 bacteriophage tail fiber protein [Herbaspirillum seropedicae SmR1]AKN63941.1 tail fiber protein [Herbaspirillum seropedicae]NQE29312.1 tail fiber protein [Herbaspirillum seropedicae]UMU19851.1 phage tail protein [Herbaspirillum seropedicae]